MPNNLNLNTKLTLKQFIDLFNDENENNLWDLFKLQVTDAQGDVTYDWSNVRIVSRNQITIY